MLYGYGSYGASMEPSFDFKRYTCTKNGSRTNNYSSSGGAFCVSPFQERALDNSISLCAILFRQLRAALTYCMQ